LRIRHLEIPQQTRIPRDELELPPDHIRKAQRAGVARTNNLPRCRLEQMPMFGRKFEAAQDAPLFGGTIPHKAPQRRIKF
jgi:hypothetical protein